MEERMNLHAWIGSFIIGDFDSADVKTQIKAGWYDWFCKDASLARKTKRMGNIISQLRECGKVDFKNLYVWFKNNCPLSISEEQSIFLTNLKWWLAFGTIPLS